MRWEAAIPSDLPTLKVDPVRLAQAEGNLVSNAIKYTPEGGKVAIEAGANRTAVWIKVNDSGPGIGREELDRIFTPFYRGQSGGRFPQGMGLGLSIAKDLIIAHGGRLEVESSPDGGSCFTLWLPIAPDGATFAKLNR